MYCAMIPLLIFGAITPLTAATKPPSPAISQGRGGKLVYIPDPNGDRIPDFSYAGYMAGAKEIPDAPIRVAVAPVAGDNTARIQRAIDYVASLPLDKQNLRGAVLLEKGKFNIGGSLRINASGVILRGSGAGDAGTILLASGLDRRTLILISGKYDPKLGPSIAVPDHYVPIDAMRFSIAGTSSLKPGDEILITRPCTQAWIDVLHMNDMGGERHGGSWKPGSREIHWNRTINSISGSTINLDAPLTTALDPRFGGGTFSTITWPGRITAVGVENLSCESAVDSSNPKDENHSWIAINIDNARDCWVRQVNFTHFVSSAVAIQSGGQRITVEDCKSLDPVSEIAGQRRRSFYTAGQQTLFQRCYSEHGRHDFAVGFCAAGPNAFVQCRAEEALNETGPLDSWASGVLYDNVRVDGNALSLRDRNIREQFAGWSAANSCLWQCDAAVINLFDPPTAHNWAFGCWGQFNGTGQWSQCNEAIHPESLYYAQLAERIGPDALKRAQMMRTLGDASSSPTPQEAARLIADARQPGPRLRDWIDEASQRNPIPTSPHPNPPPDYRGRESDSQTAASEPSQKLAPSPGTPQNLTPSPGTPHNPSPSPGTPHNPAPSPGTPHNPCPSPGTPHNPAPSPGTPGEGRGGGLDGRHPAPIQIVHGRLIQNGHLLTGARQQIKWWAGGVRPQDLKSPDPNITRFVPGRTGPGLTDDLDQLTDRMRDEHRIALEYHYGLWYDTRDADHERIRRMDGDVWPPFYELPFARSGTGLAWDGLSKYDLTKYNPWYFSRLKQFADLCDRRWLILIHQDFFQHNILEAGAHWASCPWRSANNINQTGFPEPPPYAGDKRIFMAEQFYDVTNSTRAAIYRAYIRKCLDTFADNSNVIHLTSAEFTGPLHFMQFWLDCIAEWEKETGKHPIIGLSCTKDVQDAILADPVRSKIVSVIDIRYWWYQADGKLYAPKGGQNLSPRQLERVFKPKSQSSDSVAREVREYRQKYPDKAVIDSTEGGQRYGEAVLNSGGSLPNVESAASMSSQSSQRSQR
jgi:hypothetical protein